MWTKNVVLIAALMACLAPASGVAEKIGDTAPALQIKEWVKGGAVEVQKGTNTYVLAFWAALSPASRASLPKLSALEQKFKDKGVVVVGISDEPADKVKEFLGLAEVPILFTVAADDERKTSRSYMMAYGQSGIPYAFVIGNGGRVLWHGHPMAGLDKTLDEITTGRYDLERAIRADSVRAELDDYRMLARKGDPKAGLLGRKLLTDRTNSVTRLCDLAYRIVTDTANTNRDFVLAGEALDKAEKLGSSKSAALIFARAVFLFEQGKQEEGIALATEAVGLADNPKEKAAIQMRLHVMEGRREAETRRKSKQPPATP